MVFNKLRIVIGASLVLFVLIVGTVIGIGLLKNTQPPIVQTIDTTKTPISQLTVQQAINDSSAQNNPAANPTTAQSTPAPAATPTNTVVDNTPVQQPEPQPQPVIMHPRMRTSAS